MNYEQNSTTRCTTHLNSKELSLLKKMICQKEDGQKDDTRQKIELSKIYCKTNTPSKGVEKKQTLPKKFVSFEQQDIAAKKIQNAYRSYRRRKIAPSTGTTTQSNVTSNFQKREHPFRSRSDPSILSVFKSSTYPAGMCDDAILPSYLNTKTVFVFGGGNQFGHSTSGRKIHRYVVESNSWRNCGELPESLLYHSAVFFQNKIYVAGGKYLSKHIHEGSSVSRQVWQYNPSRKNWSRMNDMLHARHSFGFVAFQKKLFAIGGRDDTGRTLASVEKLDTYTGTWVEVRPMNLRRSGLAAAVFTGGIWVAGGLDNASYPMNSVEYYNYQQNIWSQCSNLRFLTAFSCMVPMDDRLYLIGGSISLTDTLSGSGKNIDVLDSESGTWCLASTMRKPRQEHAAVHVRDDPSQPGLIFILGGMSSKYKCATDIVECWREDDDQWIRGVAPLPNAVCGLAALALPSHIMD